MIRKIPGVGGLIAPAPNNAPSTQAIASTPIASANKPTPSGQTYNFASGNLGILAAVERERRSMPSGASVAVANTSELILNKGQQQSLGGGNLTINGGITINSAATDAGAIAKDVMSEIERQWVAFQRNKVAPGFG